MYLGFPDCKEISQYRRRSGGGDEDAEIIGNSCAASMQRNHSNGIDLCEHVTSAHKLRLSSPSLWADSAWTIMLDPHSMPDADSKNDGELISRQPVLVALFRFQREP